MTTHPVIEEIAAERERQIESEGWTSAHDDAYVSDDLSLAAASYLIHPRWPNYAADIWPWAHQWWKPTSRRRDLVKAGALIVAEIERIDRANAAATPAAQ